MIFNISQVQHPDFPIQALLDLNKRNSVILLFAKGEVLRLSYKSVLLPIPRVREIEFLSLTLYYPDLGDYIQCGCEPEFFKLEDSAVAVKAFIERSKDPHQSTGLGFIYIDILGEQQ